MSNLGDLRQDAQRLAGQNTRIKICGLKRPEEDVYKRQTKGYTEFRN